MSLLAPTEEALETVRDARGRGYRTIGDAGRRSLCATRDGLSRALERMLGIVQHARLLIVGGRVDEFDGYDVRVMAGVLSRTEEWAGLGRGTH